MNGIFLLVAVLLGQAGQEIERIGTGSPFGGNYLVTQVQAHGSGCQDVEAFDFRNHHFRATAGFGPTDLPMADGAFDDWNILNQVEWSVKMEGDRLLGNGGDSPIRVITLFSSHVGGSGSITRLFAFRCVDGELIRVLESGGEGLRVEYSAATLDVTFAIWEQADDHASPSGREKRSCRWDRRKNIFHCVPRKPEQQSPARQRGVLPSLPFVVSPRRSENARASKC